MRLKRWGVPAVVAVAGCVGLMLSVDFLFKSAVSMSGAERERVVAMAQGGFLSSRRAAYVVCAADGKARVVAKVRLEQQDFLEVGGKAGGTVQIAAWERRGRPDVTVEVPITLTSKDWVETLESDALPREALGSIAAGLRNSALDFIGIHAFEHGTYFRRDNAPTDLRALDRCVAG